MYYYGPSQKDVIFIIGSNVATSMFLMNLDLTSSVANELSCGGYLGLAPRL